MSERRVNPEPVLREHAEDVQAFDAFTHQWYFEVVVPRYTIDSAAKTGSGSTWEVEFEVTNRGTSTMPART